MPWATDTASYKHAKLQRSVSKKSDDAGETKICAAAAAIRQMNTLAPGNDGQQN